MNLSISKCSSCGVWSASFDCPCCHQTTFDYALAGLWAEEESEGTGNECELEGVAVVCPHCEWSGEIVEVSSNSRGRLAATVDSDEV